MPTHDSDIETSGASRKAGRYANYFEIGHNAFEFVLDFGQLYAGEGQPRFHTRVVSGPAYAKALSHTLKVAVGEYERDFGTVDEAEQPEPLDEQATDGEQNMIAPSQPLTPEAGAASSATLQDLVKQLTESIEYLQQSISAEEASLSAQTRQLAYARESLTATQQALQQEDQLATGYGDALGRFDTSWNDLKQPLETVRGKLKVTLDETALKAITAKVKAYDDEGTPLVKAAEMARAAQATADEAVADAKAVQQEASAALEQLSQSVIAKGMALEKWRAAIAALGQELQTIDPQAKPARAWFLLAEVDRFVAMRAAAATADQYRDDLDAQWAAVIGAKQEVADAQAGANEAAEAAQGAEAVRQEHDGKRRDVLLAAMDTLDAARPQQAQTSQSRAAAAS